MDLFHTPPAPPSDSPPASLPQPLAERVQLWVVEYAGALAPGLVVAVAEATAAALRALGSGTRQDDDFLGEWQEATRRRLSEHVVTELASVRRTELAGVA